MTQLALLFESCIIVNKWSYLLSNGFKSFQSSPLQSQAALIWVLLWTLSLSACRLCSVRSFFCFYKLLFTIFHCQYFSLIFSFFLFMDMRHLRVTAVCMQFPAKSIPTAYVSPAYRSNSRTRAGDGCIVYIKKKITFIYFGRVNIYI